MIPEIDTQLSAVVRALETTIKPCLGEANPLAMEQVGLCIKMLEIVRSHFPYYDKYLRADIRDNLALGQELLKIPTPKDDSELQQNLIAVLNQAEADLKNADSGIIELQVTYQSIREAIAKWVSACNEGGFNTEANRLVLSYSERMTERGRSWNLAMGFEGQNSQLPGIEAFL